MEPTVFTDVEDHMFVADEESFGPIMIISKFQDGSVLLWTYKGHFDIHKGNYSQKNHPCGFKLIRSCCYCNTFPYNWFALFRFQWLSINEDTQSNNRGFRSSNGNRPSFLVLLDSIPQSTEKSDRHDHLFPLVSNVALCNFFDQHFFFHIWSVNKLRHKRC